MTAPVERPYRDDDRPQVLALLAATLGWLPDEHHAAFFEWKHRRNPFGESPAWVAEADGRVVGFRAFLRWEFGVDGDVVRAVRAVDTATDPAHRGGGVFTCLTRLGLDALAADGVGFVFNTPNDQSLPGYLKMGWETVGRPPLHARPRTPLGLLRMAASRTAADLWSLPTSAGVPAGDALFDRGPLDELLVTQPVEPSLHTRRTPDYLVWRYAGFAPLAYRALLAGDSPADGVALFRLRRRGRAVEAAVGEVIVPGADPRLAARLAAGVVRRSGADYALRCGGREAARAGFLPVPGAGPVLAWRGVTDHRRPELARWRLTLGDLELF